MKGIRLNRQIFLVGVSLLLTIVMMAACMPVQPAAQVEAQPAPETDMEAVVNAIWTEYAAANVAGDAERWIALWDENGVKMPPGSPPIEGKENILARKQAAAAKWITNEMTITDLEYEVAGDWAYVRGVYSATDTPTAGGESVKTDGKYMSILHRQPDGSWKLYRDLSNSNTP